MALIKKGSKLYSVLHFKCPFCHEGGFFQDNNPYKLNKLSATHKHCETCNGKLYVEPGFYFGSMYVVYGLSGAHFIAFWVAATILGIDFEYWAFVIFVSITLLLISPVYYALSKIIWANMFMRYKGDKDLTVKQRKN